MSLSSPISWIITEERFKRRKPPQTTPISHGASPTPGRLRVIPAPLKRTSSPRPSSGEKKNSSLSTTLNRFTLFENFGDDVTDGVDSVTSGSGKKGSLSGRKKKSGICRSPRIGKLGEVFSEEPEPLPRSPQ